LETVAPHFLFLTRIIFFGGREKIDGGVFFKITYREKIVCKPLQKLQLEAQATPKKPIKCAPNITRHELAYFPREVALIGLNRQGLALIGTFGEVWRKWIHGGLPPIKKNAFNKVF
jgi:hypothetical protein